MTNLTAIIAKERIHERYFSDTGHIWVGDFEGYCLSYEEAFKEEIEYLMEDYKNGK